MPTTAASYRKAGSKPSRSQAKSILRAGSAGGKRLSGATRKFVRKAARGAKA